jgi:hypothetical protein
VQGVSGALETLVRYNLEDVVHLPTLLALVYNTRIQQAPFSMTPIIPPPEPPICFGFDESLIYRTLEDTGRMASLADSQASPNAALLPDGSLET